VFISPLIVLLVISVILQGISYPPPSHSRGRGRRDEKRSKKNRMLSPPLSLPLPLWFFHTTLECSTNDKWFFALYHSNIFSSSYSTLYLHSPRCNNASGCYYTNRSCDDNDACTVDSCNSDTGCNNTNICNNQIGTSFFLPPITLALTPLPHSLPCNFILP
jgi:hypothetical protein